MYDNYINDINLKNIKKDIITDKNTENFKFLGIIKTFFTNSKIINCVRDPFENFCSLYKTNFNSSGLNWTNSQKEIFMYHKNYFVPLVFQLFYDGIDTILPPLVMLLL